jgi:hypothetical protein
MKTKIAVAAFVLAALFAAPAFAQPVSQLLGDCNAAARIDAANASNDFSHVRNTDYMDGAACAAYFVETLDSLSENYEINVVNARQVIKIFRKYLNDHLEINPDMPARQAVISALLSSGVMTRRARN